MVRIISRNILPGFLEQMYYRFMLSNGAYPSVSQRADIYELGVKNQLIMSRALDLGFIAEAKQLQQIDRELFYLLKQTRKPFNFVGHIAGGNILLVGEGNLSFALSLAKKHRINPPNITASTLEKTNELSNFAAENTNKLRAFGVKVLHGINATKIHRATDNTSFDHIIFQFPHAGSREPIDGHNPNFILVRDFLKSAIRKLKRSGTVLISAVDTPHYHGAFQFDEAASIAGFQPPKIYKFAPSVFPDYHHTMTHQDENALSNHDAFATWLFKPK